MTNDKKLNKIAKQIGTNARAEFYKKLGIDINKTIFKLFRIPASIKKKQISKNLFKLIPFDRRGSSWLEKNKDKITDKCMNVSYTDWSNNKEYLEVHIFKGYEDIDIKEAKAILNQY